MRKGADNKVFREKLSLNWTGPFKIIAVGPAPAADTPDGRPLGDKLLYLDLPSNLSGPAAKPRVTVARCKPCANPYDAAAHRCRGYLPGRPCGRNRRRRAPCTAPAGTLGPRANNHSDLCRTPYIAAAHCYRGYFPAAPVAATAAAVPPAPPRPEDSAHAPLTTATSVAPHTLPQHTATAVTFAAALVAASTAAPVAASAAAALPAPLRQQNPALAPCTSAAFIAPTAPLRQQNPALAPCNSAAFIAPTVPLRQQNPALAPYTCYGSDSALAPCNSAAFIAPTAPLRQQNSALAPCTSAAFIAPTALLRQQNSALAPCTPAAFIAPTVPLRQQNSALAPCTCYGSNTRPSRHSPPGPRTATILGARIMIDGITGKYTRAPTLSRIALMARPVFSMTRSLPQR